MKVSCPICLEVFTENSEVSSTPCGHLFHSHCLTRSIETNNTCPQCRKSCAERVQVHRVYLSSKSEDNVWSKREIDLLHTFAKNGELEWYKKITETSENKNPSNQFGWTPLHVSAQYGQLAICQFILERAKDKNPKDQFGKTPLDLAAENDQLATCVFIYKYVEDKHKEMEFKGSWEYDTIVHILLHWAAENGHLSLCRLLTKPGRIEDTNVPDNTTCSGRLDKWTPLHKAAWNGHIEICRLLDKNIPWLPKDNKGRTPLHWAARKGHTQVCLYFMREFIQGSDKFNNPEDNQGYTPLHLAAEFGHYETCKVIIENIWDKNPCSARDWKYSPLHKAAANNHLKVCLLILQYAEVKNPADKEGETPLHLAAENGHSDVCRLIMLFSQSKNPADKNGKTPLHLAAENDHHLLVKKIMNDIQHYQDKRVLNLKFYNHPEEPKNPSQSIKSFVCTCEVLPHSYCMSCKSISDENAEVNDGNENLEIVRDGNTDYEEEVEEDDIDDNDDTDDDDDNIDDDEELEEEEVDQDSEDLEGEEEEEVDDDSEDLEGEEEENNDEFD